MLIRGIGVVQFHSPPPVERRLPVVDRLRVGWS